MAVEYLSEAISLIYGTILAGSLFWFNHKIKLDKDKSVKMAIKKTMQEVNVIFQQANEISHDYVYGEEEASKKLINFMRRNSKKLDNYSFILSYNTSLTTMTSKESENVSMFLTLIDWFIEEYTFTFEPQPRQISRWNYDRENLFKNTEKIEEISETFCK